MSILDKSLTCLAPEREYLLAELQGLTNKIFSNSKHNSSASENQQIKLEIFGSMATGLALETSDMDVAVVGLEIEDRYGMVENLKKLASGIQKEWSGYIEGFKAIDTATIPVIKMKVDLLKMREQRM